MRGVLHGDRVVATVSGIDHRGRLEGAVISVIERANSTLVGRLFIEDGIAYIVPDNKRITQNILIPADMLGGGRPHGTGNGNRDCYSQSWPAIRIF